MAVAVLAVVATTAMGGLLGTMAHARRGFDRAQAAAWVQSELDFLRVQGYGIATGSRRVPDASDPQNDSSTGYLPDYGTGLSEPRIPPGFYQAQIDVASISGLPLKSLSVKLYQTPGSPPYTILVTYVSQFSYP